MPIEVPIRKEIANFESRPAFNMTMRQIICTAIAIPVGVAAYLLLNQVMEYKPAAGLTMLIVSPIFAFGLFKKNGYTLEKYLKIVWQHRFKPQKRLYVTENPVREYMEPDERKKDLSHIILVSSIGKTTAQAETTITYHATVKQERAVMRAARRECAAAAKTFAKQQKEAARQEKKGGGTATPPGPVSGAAGCPIPPKIAPHAVRNTKKTIREVRKYVWHRE